MVTRVYGSANGVEISFEQVEGGKWQATVPANLEGECIVEIYAEDDTGNVTYICKALFVISGHELECYVVPNEYHGSATAGDYSGFPKLTEYLGKISNIIFSAEAKKIEFVSAIEKGGYTIGNAVCRRVTY